VLAGIAGDGQYNKTQEAAAQLPLAADLQDTTPARHNITQATRSTAAHTAHHDTTCSSACSTPPPLLTAWLAAVRHATSAVAVAVSKRIHISSCSSLRDATPCKPMSHVRLLHRVFMAPTSTMRQYQYQHCTGHGA
jgi:hypothetical protein